MPECSVFRNPEGKEVESFSAVVIMVINFSTRTQGIVHCRRTETDGHV